jgi:hypothetical protein
VGSNSRSKLTHDGSISNVVTAAQFDAETAGAIAVGLSHACFVSNTTGIIRCAGSGLNGGLGDGLDTHSATLVIATALTQTPTVLTSAPTVSAYN